MDTTRNADAPAGFDEEDPYKDTPIEQLDPWWRENVQLFEAHGMRPYRPPQFADGVHTPPVIQQLENEYDVVIQFRVVDPQIGQDWVVRIDDTPVTTIERYRDDGGYSVYTVGADEFESLVREYLEEITSKA